MWTDQPELKATVPPMPKDNPRSEEANGQENGGQPEIRCKPASRVEGAQLVGIVKRYSSKNGYGFITVEDGGPDCFVHQSEIVVDGFRCLEEGARVQFRHVTRKEKPTATQVRPLPGSRFKVFKSRADAQTKNVQSSDLGHVSGYVKWFDVQKGFGFIVLDESADRPSADVFVHIKEVSSQLPLQEGQRVAFELTEEAGGRFKAFNVCAVAGQMQFYPPVGEAFAPSYSPQFTNTGVVRFFNQDRGYGFLTPTDNTPDIYFNRTAIVSGDVVKEGDVLGYDLSGNGTKTWAVNVLILELAEALSPGHETYDYAPLVYPYSYGDLTTPAFGFENVSFDPNLIYYPP
jgi:CspA family cold shock protein